MARALETKLNRRELKRLRATVEERARLFMQQNPGYSTPEGAEGNCGIASAKLIRLLKRKEVDCWPLYCTVPYGPLAHFWPHSWHYVVCVNHLFIVLDPTAKQVDPKHDPVRFMTLGELQREWLHYKQSDIR